MFMFWCSLAFMFPCTFALALAAGLGEVVVVAFVLAFALFEFSVVLQAAPNTPKASKIAKPALSLISVSPSLI